MITYREKLRLATLAELSLGTVDKYFAGGSVREGTRARLEKGLVRLGLKSQIRPPPTPAASADATAT